MTSLNTSLWFLFLFKKRSNLHSFIYYYSTFYDNLPVLAAAPDILHTFFYQSFQTFSVAFSNPHFRKSLPYQKFYNTIYEYLYKQSSHIFQLVIYIHLFIAQLSFVPAFCFVLCKTPQYFYYYSSRSYSLLKAPVLAAAPDILVLRSFSKKPSRLYNPYYLYFYYKLFTTYTHYLYTPFLLYPLCIPCWIIFSNPTIHRLLYFFISFFPKLPVLAAAPDNIIKHFSKLIVVLLLIPISMPHTSYYIYTVHLFSFFGLQNLHQINLLSPQFSFLLCTYYSYFYLQLPVLAAALDNFPHPPPPLFYLHRSLCIM